MGARDEEVCKIVFKYIASQAASNNKIYWSHSPCMFHYVLADKTMSQDIHVVNKADS